MNLMKMRFNQLFNINPDGTLTPKKNIRFNGDERKAGSSFYPGATLGRVDLRPHIGHTVEVEEEGDSAIIMGFYPN